MGNALLQIPSAKWRFTSVKVLFYSLNCILAMSCTFPVRLAATVGLSVNLSLREWWPCSMLLHPLSIQGSFESSRTVILKTSCIHLCNNNQDHSVSLIMWLRKTAVKGLIGTAVILKLNGKDFSGINSVEIWSKMERCRVCWSGHEDCHTVNSVQMC